MINFKTTSFLLFLLIYSSNSLACLVPISIPPPGPNGEYIWGNDDKVVFGVVSSVEKNLNLNWVERKLVDLKIMNNSSPGAATPLHKVELKSIRYYIGTGTNPISFELHGCGLEIPKLGWRGIFFISGKGEDQKIVPLYESDERFSEWLKMLEKIDVKKY